MTLIDHLTLWSETHPSASPRIVETGITTDVLELARWLFNRRNPSADLCAASLQWDHLGAMHALLEQATLAQYCTFKLQDPIQYLQTRTWIDVAVLNEPYGLDQAVDEFRAAASAGASLVVLSKYQTRSIRAVLAAKSLGWAVEHDADRSYLTRP